MKTIDQRCHSCGKVDSDLHFAYGYGWAGSFCVECCPGKDEACDHNCDDLPRQEES